MRISELGMQQILLSGFQNAQGSAQIHQVQLSSGDRFQTYGGYGADTLRLISSEGVVSRASAFENAAGIALSRLEMQGASLETVAGAVEETRAAFTRTLATGNAELLLPELENAAQRVIAALNVDFGGTYIFGGAEGSAPPVLAASLGDIASAGSIDDLFRDGDRISLTVEAGVSVDGGARASEIARDLFAELQELANTPASLGAFSGNLTAAQRDLLIEKSARFAELADDLYREQGLSAVAQGQAGDAIDRNVRTRDLAEIVAAEIEDVDIAEALSRLNQDQLAIQASAQALAQASQLSLLNFI